MSLHTVKLTGTTDGSQNATITAEKAVFGYLEMVDWVDGDLTDGIDSVLSVASTSSGTSQTLLTLTNANSDAVYYPRRVVDTTAGAAATGVYDRFLIDGYLSLAITSGGASKTGGCIVYYADC